MQIEDFPACCGAVIGYSLTNITADELKYLRKKGLSDEGFEGLPMFCITSNHQTMAISVLKKDRKSKALCCWKNPNSGQMLTLWRINP